MPNYEAVWKGEEAEFKNERNKWVVTEETFPPKKVPDFRVDMVHIHPETAGVFGVPVTQLLKNNGIMLTNVKCDIERIARGRGPKGRIYEDLLVCRPD